MTPLMRCPRPTAASAGESGREGRACERNGEATKAVAAFWMKAQYPRPVELDFYPCDAMVSRREARSARMAVGQ